MHRPNQPKNKPFFIFVRTRHQTYLKYRNMYFNFLWIFELFLQLQTPFNRLLMNLVSSDFLMLLLGIPPEIIAAMAGGWKLGYYTCIGQGFAMMLTGMGTVYSLVMLSIQRCIIVCQPIFYFNHGSQMTQMQSWIIWIVAIIIACPPLLGWNEIVPEQSGLR